MAYTTLRNGSKGSDVKKLQNALINAGYDVGTTGADGIYGSKTAAAVKAYQKANGLSVDGIAGKQTLGSLYTTKPETPKTNNDTPTTKADVPTTPTFDGVDQKYVDMTQEEYKPSEKEQEYLDNRDKYSQDLEDKINAGPQFSETVTQAFDWLGQQQDYFKNGKTSWDDKILGQISAIENREDFSYDVDKDPLFQQALASAMSSGKTAMEDTIGQASALTGGYGSTYATSAGNQAYNSFIEDAYDNLPQYYQMALSAYQAESEEMYRLLGLYNDMGTQEWNRKTDAYNSVLNYANSQREFEYGMYQDDIINTQNLVSNYDSFYKQENSQNLIMWQQEIENAWKTIERQSSDYQFEQNYNQTEEWNEKNFNEGVRQFNYSIGDTNNDGVVSDKEKAEMNATYTYDSEGKPVKVSNTSGNQNWSQSEYNNATTKLKDGGEKALTDYAETIGRQQGWSETTIDNFVDAVMSGNSGGSAGSGAGITISGFRTTKGDNFTVKIGDNSYKVENKGKVESQDTLKSIGKGQSYGDIVIAENGNTYIKNGKDYYRIGDLNGLFNIGISSESGYSDLLFALRNK